VAWEGGEGSEALWNALLCPESLPGALSSKHVFQTRANTCFKHEQIGCRCAGGGGEHSPGFTVALLSVD
jgi:hypothetical protein